MLKVEQFMNIKELRAEKHSIHAISKITGHSRNTIRKVLRGEHTLKMKSPERDSKLDPYKDYIRKRYEEAQLSAVRLLPEIKPMGYKGSIDTLRRFLRTLKQRYKRQNKLTVRFETPPGKQMQADWTHLGRFPTASGQKIPVYAFSMVLCFSRMLFVCFTTSMKLGQLIECHKQAFAFFGGCTETVLYDNMKQVRLSPAGAFNEQFLDFANHYGFVPKTHRAYRPRTKGKVERTMDYIKDNFLAGRSFEGIDDLNAQGVHWLEHTANIRIHGTTAQRPVDLFDKDKSALISLEGIRPYAFIDPVNRVVNNESMVQFKGSRYSVPPAFAGQTVLVAASGGQIVIRSGDMIVAEHKEALRPGQCIVEKEHLAELWKITCEQTKLPTDKVRWQVNFEQSVQTTPLMSFEEVAS